MKATEVKKLVPTFNTVSKRNGVYTARKSFYYRMGNDQYSLAKVIEESVPGAVVLDKGEQYKAFRGGDTVAQGSHWWVKFRIEGEE